MINGRSCGACNNPIESCKCDREKTVNITIDPNAIINQLGDSRDEMAKCLEESTFPPQALYRAIKSLQDEALFRMFHGIKRSTRPQQKIVVPSIKVSGA